MASGKAKSAFWLLVISILVTSAFGLIALPFFLASKAAPGDRIREAVGSSGLSIVVSVVLLGPLIEEIIFRGWLSGTWRALITSAFALLVFYAGSALLAEWFAQFGLLKQLVAAMSAIIVLFILSPLDSGRRVPGFERAFPLVFWSQGVVFGILHFYNLAASSPAIQLVSTLPLIVCGMIWGYARIKLGLV